MPTNATITSAHQTQAGRWELSGSHLVALGAGLWSLDSLFRSKLVGSYSPFFIVFISQLICAGFVFPICWGYRERIRTLPWRDWLAFLFLAGAGNILAMAAFTYAFAHTSNYSIPILIQKLQPFVAIFSAVVFLKEKLPRGYFLCLLGALAGSCLITFGSGARDLHLRAQDLEAMLFALAAASIWGLGTAFGRFISLRHPHWLVTSLRYSLSLLMILALLPLWWGELAASRAQLVSDLPNFLGMALVPGLLALLIYYRGMQVTKASVACLLELAYPLMAVLVNWAFLGKALNALQIAGGIILVASAGLISYRQAGENY